MRWLLRLAIVIQKTAEDAAEANGVDPAIAAMRRTKSVFIRLWLSQVYAGVGHYRPNGCGLWAFQFMR